MCIGEGSSQTKKQTLQDCKSGLIILAKYNEIANMREELLQLVRKIQRRIIEYRIRRNAGD